jgi:hypothetical protein
MSKSLLQKHTSAKVLVDKWIEILQNAGYTYDEMIVVFRLAKKKSDFMLNEESTCK